MWGARPAANTACRPAQSQKLRPGVGAPTKQPVRGATLCRWHAFLVGGATRGEYSLPARSKPEASPQGRGSHESSRCVAPRYAGGTLFLWGARPAANTACRPAQSQKLRPEGGAPTKAAGAWRHVRQVTRFSCGRRDPRRMQLAGPLKTRSFAPRAGLPRKQPVRGVTLCSWHAFLVGGATRGECSLPTRPTPKASPRGRASHEAARAWRRYVQPGLLHQHVAQLQAIAGMQIGQLRPQIFRQVYQHASRARRFGAFQVEAVVADHHQFARRHGPAVRQV